MLPVWQPAGHQEGGSCLSSCASPLHVQPLACLLRACRRKAPTQPTRNSALIPSCCSPPLPCVSSVAYISGICLLVAVAICLLLVACVLRRKDRRQAAALAAQQEAQLAAATAAAQQEAAYRAAHPPTIPVVIVNPDGQFELAEEIKGHSPAAKAGGSDVPEEWGTSGGSKGGEAPIGFHTSRA